MTRPGIYVQRVKDNGNILTFRTSVDVISDTGVTCVIRYREYNGADGCKAGTVKKVRSKSVKPDWDRLR